MCRPCITIQWPSPAHVVGNNLLISCCLHLAGGFSDSSVRIYDLEKMAAAGTQAQDEAAGSGVSLLWGHSAAVYGLDYTPDHQLLFTTSADGTVRLWSTELAVNLVAYRYPTAWLLDKKECNIT